MVTNPNPSLTLCTSDCYNFLVNWHKLILQILMLGVSEEVITFEQAKFRKDILIGYVPGGFIPLHDKGLSKCVKSFWGHHFEGLSKNITPTNMRHSFANAYYHQWFGNGDDHRSRSKFLDDLAGLMNTSPKQLVDTYVGETINHKIRPDDLEIGLGFTVSENNEGVRENELGISKKKKKSKKSKKNKK